MGAGGGFISAGGSVTSGKQVLKSFRTVPVTWPGGITAGFTVGPRYRLPLTTWFPRFTGPKRLATFPLVLAMLATYWPLLLRFGSVELKLSVASPVPLIVMPYIVAMAQSNRGRRSLATR